jgi:hypothetical protein
MIDKIGHLDSYNLCSVIVTVSGDVERRHFRQTVEAAYKR